MHGGVHDVPRSDAIRFGRTGGLLRRSRILSSSVLCTVRVYRECPPPTTTMPEGGGMAPSGGERDDLWSAPLGIETTGGGGYWVLEMADKRVVLAAMKGDPARKGGVTFQTALGEEIETVCESVEAYRMWLGLAAVVSPAGLRSD